MYVNYATKEIFFKVAYIGTPSGGSLDSFFALYSRTRASKTKDLECGEIEGGGKHCTFTVGLGELRGYKTRSYVVALSAKSATEAQDRLLLRGADVVVFTASATEPVESSRVRLNNVRSLVGETPVVVQANRGNGGGSFEVLANSFQVPLTEILPIRAQMSQEQAVAGVDPRDEEGVVAAFKVAAKRAMVAARDGTKGPEGGLQPGERYAKVGKYKILVPAFWQDFKTVEEPPAYLFHDTVPHLYFEATVFEGSSEKASMLLGRYSKPFRAGDSVGVSLEVAGLPFVGTRLRKLAQEKLKRATVELYAGRVGDDLLVFQIALLDEHATESLRRLCLTMVEAAIIRRMNEDPSPWTSQSQ